jgi:hypothetical protein
LLGPLTEVAWPWPWVDVGVISDLRPLIAGGKRFGGVLGTCTAGDVGRAFAVHLVLEGVAMQLIT